MNICIKIEKQSLKVFVPYCIYNNGPNKAAMTLNFELQNRISSAWAWVDIYAEFQENP